jgi:hypothetical protein
MTASSSAGGGSSPMVPSPGRAETATVSVATANRARASHSRRVSRSPKKVIDIHRSRTSVEANSGIAIPSGSSANAMICSSSPTRKISSPVSQSRLRASAPSMCRGRSPRSGSIRVPAALNSAAPT